MRRISYVRKGDRLRASTINAIIDAANKDVQPSSGMLEDDAVISRRRFQDDGWVDIETDTLIPPYSIFVVKTVMANEEFSPKYLVTWFDPDVVAAPFLFMTNGPTEIDVGKGRAKFIRPGEPVMLSSNGVQNKGDPCGPVPGDNRIVANTWGFQCLYQVAHASRTLYWVMLTYEPSFLIVEPAGPLPPGGQVWAQVIKFNTADNIVNANRPPSTFFPYNITLWNISNQTYNVTDRLLAYFCQNSWRWIAGWVPCCTSGGGEEPPPPPPPYPT